VEGTWRAHQVPLSADAEHPEHVAQLERWMRSYRPEELFDEAGRLVPDLRELAPKGERRMSANPHANGGLKLKDLRLPDIRKYGVDVKKPGATIAESTRVQGKFLRDVMKLNLDHQNFRVFSPDENNSNRWQDVLEVTNRAWDAEILSYDDHLAPGGRVMEVLSEHQCQGWLEGYLLTGRHGFFSCYEAFIHIVDSMFNQHAKWLKVHRELAWRQPVASLNYVLSSHVWQQDHNGFSHQDPGFIDHAVNKKAEVIRVYLPPDANTLLSVMEHCLASRDYVNIVVSGKQPSPTWLGPADAAHHCQRGLGIWEFAGSEVPGEEPDVVLACAGDVPTVETVAAAQLLREGAPGLKIRVVNVVDLMRLQDSGEHPHGLTSRDFDGIFTADKPIIFAYHGYASLIHRLAYRRTNQEGLHVRGYKEEGTTTTAFDMAMLNGIDRFQLAIDAIDRVPGLAERHSLLRQALQDARIRAHNYTRTHGEDQEEIRDWTLNGG
jgi:xylulose-5-phosphate/fructose-6-phosphate phosphoketolase